MALWALAVMGGLAALAGVGWLIWQVPPALYSYVPEPKDRAGAESATRTGLIAGLAGLAALGGLAVTARTYRITQQGHITDRYTKAVAQLGDDKLDIRLGGIYALERLAVDSKRDHPTVVEVLSAYVRERTAFRAAPRVRPPGRRTTRPSQGSRPRSMPRVQPMGRATAYPLRLTAKPAPLGVDIQAALTVLGRLPARSGVKGADLSGANLTETTLVDADLSRANLRKANLTKAFLFDANLTEAALFDANLTEAGLLKANLIEANLSHADLTRANLSLADLTGANLFRADLTGADLSFAILTGANLTGADLIGADLSFAILTEAKLPGADLTGAKLGGARLIKALLTGADLTGATLLGARLTRAHLASVRWNTQTVWPAGLDDEIRARSKATENGFLVDPEPRSALERTVSELLSDYGLAGRDHPPER